MSFLCYDIERGPVGHRNNCCEALRNRGHFHSAATLRSAINTKPWHVRKLIPEAGKTGERDRRR